MRELVLGGVKSGKSTLALELATASAGEVVFIATATAGDEEMRRRIERHRRERPANMEVVEEPLHLAGALEREARSGRCLLVDCLTLWLSNLLVRTDDALLAAETGALVDTLPSLPGHVVLVANETGLGIVPDSALARRFNDEAGVLHQRLAARSDRVILVAAGLPLVLKGPPL